MSPAGADRRPHIGAELFCQGLTKDLAAGTTAPVTLDCLRQFWESVYGASRADFFRRRYNEPGVCDH